MTMNTVLQWVGAAIVGALATILVAWINRGPTLSHMVNEQVQILLAGYKERLEGISKELAQTTQELRQLRRDHEAALNELKYLRDFIAAQGLKAPKRAATGAIS
jgi:hypothetical protein